MHPSRRIKNLALCVANIALLLVVLPKYLAQPETVGFGMRIWLATIPFVLLAVLVTPPNFRLAGAIHACLFLATGAAIGLTVGSYLGGDVMLMTAELLWLPFGIAVAVCHYWPSDNDQYR